MKERQNSLVDKTVLIFQIGDFVKGDSGLEALHEVAT